MLPPGLSTIALIGGCLLILFGKKIQEQRSNLAKYIPLNDLKPIPTNIPIQARGMVSCDHPLTGPVSHKPTVYYTYTLERQVMYEKVGGQKYFVWETSGTPVEQKTPFKLVDNEGEAIIEVHNAQVESGTVTEKIFHNINELSDNQKSLVESIISLALNPNIENELHRAREMSLCVGETVNVFGVARIEGNTIYISGTSEYPLIISSKSKDMLMGADAQFARLVIWGGACAIGVSCLSLLFNYI